MNGHLAGKRILVVEDEYFIASDLARALKALDAEVVGPAGDVERALRLVDGALDAALLDVNLEGARSFAIADRLSEHDVPYMFLTGYDHWALPPAYRDAPRMAKPFTMHAVVAGVGQLLGGARA